MGALASRQHTVAVLACEKRQLAPAATVIRELVADDAEVIDRVWATGASAPAVRLPRARARSPRS